MSFILFACFLLFVTTTFIVVYVTIIVLQDAAAFGGQGAPDEGDPDAVVQAICDAEAVSGGDPRATEHCLSVLEGGATSLTMERQFRHFPEAGLRRLLVAAAGRPSGAGVLIERIARLWVGRLLSGDGAGAAALQAAVRSGSAEAFAALMALGGPGLAAAGALSDAPSPRQEGSASASSGPAGGVLSLCVERGDLAKLAPLLESLRGAGDRVLGSVRGARGLAAARGQAEAGMLLATHLVAELSHSGNLQYRGGRFESAIRSYEEAISLCETSSARPARGAPHHCGSPETPRGRARGATADSPRRSEGQDSSDSTRQSLIRLRYNLARALHRTDRWSEAREQATAVLALDKHYLNAYAVRAQAAMAALDFASAQADWDRLMSIADPGAPTGGGPLDEEVVGAWRRRREECGKQVSLTL